MTDEPKPPIWSEGTLAALDFETTGVDPLTCRPVSIAFIVTENDGTVLENHHVVVNAGVDVPEGASNIHGMTTEHVREHGIEPDVAMYRLTDLIHRASLGDVPIVIFNAPFDWTLYKTECERFNLDAPDALLLDPLLFDRKFDKYRKGGKTLTACADAYGVELTQAHDASADCFAAIGVLRRQAILHAQLRHTSVVDLQIAQSKWFDQWRDGYNRWAEQKAPNRVISRDNQWPLKVK